MFITFTNISIFLFHDSLPRFELGYDLLKFPVYLLRCFRRVECKQPLFEFLVASVCGKHSFEKPFELFGFLKELEESCIFVFPRQDC